MLLRKPVILTIHGSDFRIAMEGSAFLKKIFLFVCQRAKHITCVSERMKREIEALGIQGSKIMTFPMGVEEAFLEKGWKREVDRQKGPFTIISNRNLQTIYNISHLIRAVPIVLREEPETKFLVAGDGPCRESLEVEVKNLNVDSSVRFLGRVPHEKMPDILAEADTYVSTSMYDGTSVSLLEAMAAGAFPIVTNIDANREWVLDSQNGFLVPVGDEACLAGKIIESIRNKRLLEQAREKNRKIVEQKACWGTNIEKVTDLYRCAR
jgi:glycosyltransferase involved in cell wall biosynthesis